MDLQFASIRLNLLSQSLNFLELSGLFMTSLLFFNLNFSRFELLMLMYIGIMFLSGINGLLAANFKSFALSKIYRIFTIICFLSSILLCFWVLYLIIDIVAFGSGNCNLITNGECTGLSFILILILLFLYLGISGTIAILSFSAITKASLYVHTLLRNRNSQSRLLVI